MRIASTADLYNRSDIDVFKDTIPEIQYESFNQRTLKNWKRTGLR